MAFPQAFSLETNGRKTQKTKGISDGALERGLDKGKEPWDIRMDSCYVIWEQV